MISKIRYILLFSLLLLKGLSPEAHAVSFRQIHLDFDTVVDQEGLSFSASDDDSLVLLEDDLDLDDDDDVSFSVKKFSFENHCHYSYSSLKEIHSPAKGLPASICSHYFFSLPDSHFTALRVLRL
jgi:hypothetical protein